MTRDNIFDWLRPKIYRVSDVEEVIELAEKLRQGGSYNWFRGQPKPTHLTQCRLIDCPALTYGVVPIERPDARGWVRGREFAQDPHQAPTTQFPRAAARITMR